MRLAHLGLAVDVPPGWDARIYKRDAPPEATANPVLHAANFPLPEGRGDFGTGAVETMGPGRVFVALFEYEPEAASTALFRGRARPTLEPSDFDPRQLQRTLAGQSGCQYFFTEQGRAFCLYVVLGSHAQRGVLVPKAQAMVEKINVARLVTP